jgi:outer membrane protein assembly factor BamB
LTVADDAVFFADTRSSVFALEARTGEERWRESLNPVRGSYAHTPAVEDGTVYVPTKKNSQSSSQQISTYDADSGDDETLYRTEEYSFEAGVTVANGGVFAPTTDGIRAYDEEGTLLWHFPTEKPLEGGVAVAGDVVYAISTADFSGILYAIDAKGGSENWSTEAETAPDHGPIVVGDYLIYADSHRNILCYDRFTRDTYWTLDTPFTWFEWGAFAAGHFYFADLEGRILAFSEP